MATYTPTIGLEIHAELKTATKMFCNSRNDPDETKPNVNVCPVCMSHPGTLPVVNREAVWQVLRVGAAVNGALADYTEFDRKNYFYPDLPKGYQISQYKFPLVVGGSLVHVSITRVHLEEDTARSQHAGTSSVIDFNRAGVPLMELVTDPVIHDAKTASAFARELQLLLRTLGASDANMEKGQMRVEANISVSNEPHKLGTKVEVKNLNSLRAVEGAITYEIDRQVNALQKGEEVIQETRGWNETKEETFPQRLKESSHDYRYFPDPDIPKFRISRIPEFSSKNIVNSLPELPWQKRERYTKSGIRPEDAEVLVGDEIYARIADDVIATSKNSIQTQGAISMLLSEVRGQNPPAEALLRLTGVSLLAILDLRSSGTISSAAGKRVLAVLLLQGGDPAEIAKDEGLTQVSDTSLLRSIVKELIGEFPKVALEVKGGKLEAIKFLVGNGMKKSKGSANPQELEKIIREELKL